jgi:hypothetical protein
MKINRVADEKKVSDWCLEGKNQPVEKFVEAKGITTNDIKRITNLPDSGKLSEDQLVQERETIEKCAESKIPYHFNSKWDGKTVDSLKEYAKVCGLKEDKIAPVSSEYVKEIESLSVKDEDFMKQSKKKTKLEFDPFHLNNVEDKFESKKEDWEKVNKQASLSDKPSMNSNAIRSHRGGEDYFVNSFTQTARGQNSIGNSDAIKNLIEDTQEDTGARLKKENEQKRQAKKQNHVEWQKDKIEAMSELDIVSKGKVFPTESLNAQPGVRDSFVGAYSKFDPKTIPDKTAGEKLGEKQEERKQSIQRKSEKDNDWQNLKSASNGMVSDSFSDSLKKNLKKVK